MALTPLDVLTAAGIEPDKAIEIYETLREKFDWESVHERMEDDSLRITIHVKGNPMLWYFGTDQRAYRMDEPVEFPALDSMSQREVQIAMALIDVAAFDLRDKKL
jgi:hypothetical protein